MKTSDNERAQLEHHMQGLEEMVESLRKARSESPEMFYAHMEDFVHKQFTASSVRHGNMAIPQPHEVDEDIKSIMEQLFAKADELKPDKVFAAQLSGAAVAYVAAKWIAKLQDMLLEAKTEDAPLIAVPKVRLS